MEGISLGARIRRKESLAALKSSAAEDLPEFLGFGDTSHLPGAPDVPPDTNQLQKFKDELLDIDRKKRQHLVISKPTGGGFLKFSTILVVLLFALSGVLFFAGGYLFSYSNPPPGSAISASSAAVNQNKPDWRLGTVIEGRVAAKEASIPTTYMARRTYLERNEVLADKVYGETENRVQLAAQNEAKRMAFKTTNKIKSAVRGVVGDSIARIFNPLAESVVENTVGAAIEQGIPTKEVTPGTEPGKAAGGEDAAGGASATGTTTAPAGGVGELFALELQSFLDSTDAFMFMRDLKAKGYSATYIVRAHSGGNMIYKVRVGNFANYADASETRKLIGHPSRVVMATRSDDHLNY